MPKKGKEKLTARQRIAALFHVAKISYKTAPSILYIRITSSVLNATLPIVTTFFAAQTTTELARAYSGEEGAGQTAMTFVVLTAIVGVVTISWSMLEGYMSRLARFKLEAAISDTLTHHFLSLEYWRYDDKETADLMDKSRRFSNLFSYVFDTAGSIATSLFALVASVVALALVNWWLALLLLVAVVPGLWIQYKLSKARVEHWEENIDSRRKFWNIDTQLQRIEGIAEIRLYGLVKHLLGLRRGYRNQDERDQILLERKYLKYELSSSVIEALAEVIALLYVTLQIIAHALPVGQFLYVQQIVSRGFGGTRSIAGQFMNIDEDLANLAAYDTFMNLPAGQTKKQKLRQPPDEIVFNAVTFSYPKIKTHVLNDISMTIKKNTHIAIVGENGAGKSTLVKLLLGFYYPTSGAVTIGGIPTTELDLPGWHEQLGVLQQQSVDFTFATARDNVAFGDVSRLFSESRYKKAIDAAEASEFLGKLPKKDETYITKWMESEDGTPGVMLSGGQQQRLALARNFYRDSPVVILDEPTSAIDALAESRIFKRLFEKRDKTIITISHRLSTVKRADCIYVLENGAIVESGTHAELVERNGTYVHLFESQL